MPRSEEFPCEATNISWLDKWTYVLDWLLAAPVARDKRLWFDGLSMMDPEQGTVPLPEHGLSRLPCLYRMPSACCLNEPRQTERLPSNFSLTALIINEVKDNLIENQRLKTNFKARMTSMLNNWKIQMR